MQYHVSGKLIFVDLICCILIFIMLVIILNVGIVRGHTTSLKYMAENDGYSVLLRAMQSTVEKLQIKSAFLLSSLCSRDDSNDVKNLLGKMGFIEQTAVLLSKNDLQPTVR